MVNIHLHILLLIIVIALANVALAFATALPEQVIIVVAYGALVAGFVNSTVWAIRDRRVRRGS